MTHDDYATRLWIKTKQVKSLRMNHHPKEVMFVRMVSISASGKLLGGGMRKYCCCCS